MIRSEAIAPDHVAFWDTDDAAPLPVLDGYCPVVSCCPSSLCDACLLATKPCDLCGAPATVIDRHGGQALPLCAECGADCKAEVPQWGSWRSAPVWFQGTKFINVGTEVGKVRFAEVSR